MPSFQNPTFRMAGVGLCLVAVMALSIFLKSSYYSTHPHLPDGDTYFHGMLTNYIVDNGEITTRVPYQVPTIGHGYPFNFHILSAQIHHVTGWSVLNIMRWFGPVMSMLVAAGVFIATRRLIRSDVSALASAGATLFIPLLAGRLSNTFPENVLVFFIPMLLWTLFVASEQKDKYSLIAGGLIVVSSVGYHFSSYLLMPTLGIGIFIYYIGKRWRKRNIFYMPLLVLLTLLAISVFYSNWWLFGFFKTFVAINSGPALEISSTPYALPAPTVDQWYSFLGHLPVLIGGLGVVIVAFNRSVAWRSKAIIAAYIFTVLLPLQILPSLNLFSYTPFRAFVYLGIPLVIVAGGAMAWLLQRSRSLVPAMAILMVLAIMVPNQHRVATAGAGEQHLTPGEYHGGIRWLMGNTSNRSIVITAPANGRQVALFTKQTTAYDTSGGVFYAETSEAAIQAVRDFGDFPVSYIYVSKYKLGPIYNYGWVRDYAYVDADLDKFEDQRYFYVVFEDTESIIFQARPEILERLQPTPPAGA